ncbi:MAG: Fe-S cluster assembly ATPase SufC [archaeon]
MTELLKISDLHVRVEEKDILKGVSFSIKKGEIVALMGPNGSGKSTLSQAIMGNPNFTISKGDVLFEGKSIQPLRPDERSKLGIFLSFQYPVEIPGVTLSHFLRAAINARREQKMPVAEFMQALNKNLALLHMDKSFADRYVHAGFSGGEKKMTEILQLALLQPKLAILDETDSGLDIDALKHVAEGITSVKTPDRGILIITHYQRMLNYVRPDRVLIMLDGCIKEQGGPELVEKLEKQGYDWLRT